MPVTTYVMREPGRHPDEDLAELIDEINQKTGEKWIAEDYRVWVQRWFLPARQETRTSLMKHIVGSEYQVMQCVDTVKEAKAYLYGALGCSSEGTQGELTFVAIEDIPRIGLVMGTVLASTQLDCKAGWFWTLQKGYILTEEECKQLKRLTHL